MSDNALAEAVYPGGPDNAPAAPPTPTPAPAAAPAPAAPAAEPTADAAETTSTLLTEKEDAAAAEPEKPAEEAPPPFDAEKLTIPEGMKADPEILGKFGEIATKGKLSQETAQEIVDLYHSVARNQATKNFETWQATQAEWVAAVKADPEIGEHLDDVKSTVGKILDDPNFANPKTREGFEVTGSGNHLEVIRLVYRMAKALSEGTHVTGNGPARQAAERSLAERIYPNLSER